jgi:hypothetical protein
MWSFSNFDWIPIKVYKLLPIMNALMHLVDDHLVPSLEILHIHVIFENFITFM